MVTFATEKTADSKAQLLSDTLVSKQSELTSVVKDLENIGMDKTELSNAVVSANEQATASLAKEFKSAARAYKKNKISQVEYENIVYGAAIKKLDIITSALSDTLAQKSAEAAKAAANETSEKAEKTTPPGLANKEGLPPGLAKPGAPFGLGGPGEGPGNAFGRGSDDNVGHKLGMAQVKKETISQLFDSGHGSGAINSIGNAGEGSGKFNAVSLFSLSNNINSALESYKNVQKTEKESKEAFGELA